MNQNRVLLVAGAIVVLVVGVIATVASRRAPSPSPTPAGAEARHYLLNIDQALSTFDSASVATTGSLRIGTGESPEVEALSLAVEPLDTTRGSTGPIGISLGEGEAELRGNGSASVAGTFPVRFWYPLLYQVGGEKAGDDVVRPERLHTGNATIEAKIENDHWSATISLVPAPVEGTDFNLPQGRIEIQAPAIYETDDQFARNAGGGVRVWCLDVQNERNALTAAELSTALREARTIWRTFAAAFLTRQEITDLNTALLAVEPGASELRDPGKLPVQKCYTVTFTRTLARGGGMSVDVVRRSIAIGLNVRTTCPGVGIGRLLAHALGHVALTLEQDETGRADDNLMRKCAPGETLDNEQLDGWWSYVAEIAREVTLPGAGVATNVAAAQLDTVLDRVVSGEISPVPTLLSPTPRVTARPAATPRRTATPRPSPTATPRPSATPGPSPSPTATPAPTATPGATATPPPASPSPSP